MKIDKGLARIGALLYLVLIAGGVYAEFFVRSKMIVPGNALATAQHLAEADFTFRLGVVADLIAQTCYFFLGVTVYAMFKQLNKTLSLTLVLLVAISAAVTCLNLLNQFAAVLLLSGADYLKVFSPDQLKALALFFLNLHHHGYILAALFYGGWLFPLGLLVYQSKLFPRVLGILLMIASVGYLVDFTGQFLFPDMAAKISTYTLAPATLGEIAFCFSLIYFGFKPERA